MPRKKNPPPEPKLPALADDRPALERASRETVKALLKAGFKPGHGELNIYSRRVRYA
jgi:hypothetical protein